MDIQEKVMKDREEKEAQAATKQDLAAKNAPMETSSASDKGKGLMEEIPQTSAN